MKGICEARCSKKWENQESMIGGSGWEQVIKFIACSSLLHHKLRHTYYYPVYIDWWHC